MIIIIIILIIVVINNIIEQNYKQLEAEVLKKIGFFSWNIISYFDEYVIVKSRQTLEKYDDIKYFKEHREKLVQAENIIKKKNDVATTLKRFLENNEYKAHPQYHRLMKQIDMILINAAAYRICVNYISSAGNNLGKKEIAINQYGVDKFRRDPSLLMSKGEYNKYIKEQQKEALGQKHHEYYERVNNIIEYANDNQDSLIIKGSREHLDKLIAQLFERTVNSIKKIKTIDSEEWNVIGDFMFRLKGEIEKIVSLNQKILDYYESPSFLKIKETCEVLMSTQREFNEYVTEKVQSVSQFFGTRVVRNETINDDEYWSYVKI